MVPNWVVPNRTVLNRKCAVFKFAEKVIANCESIKRWKEADKEIYKLGLGPSSAYKACKICCKSADLLWKTSNLLLFDYFN